MNNLINIIKLKGLLLMFTILFFYSCKKDSVSYKKNIFLKNKKDSIIINMPTTINPMEVYWQFNKNEKSLIDSDFPMHKIYKFDFPLKKWQIINFKTEGPNGIGNATGFYYHNKDSIFIFNAYKYSFSLFKDNGFKLNEFKKIKGYTVNIYSNRKVEKKNHFLYIPSSKFLKLDANYTKKSKLLTKYDIKNDIAKQIIGYPKIYHNKKWNNRLLQMDYIIKGDSILVSYPISHKIFIYNLNGKKIGGKIAKSNFLNNFYAINDDSNTVKAFNNLYRNGFYSGFLYDKDKKVYYRLALHLPKNNINKEIKKNDLVLSVILMDNKLNIIGESILKKASGYYNFILDNKLVVSKNPKYSNNLPENNRLFYTFEFYEN